MSVWAMVFAVLSVTEGLGDRHPGQWLPFWQRACEEDRARACAYLANVELILCDAGSGWACNESGLRARRQAGPTPGGNPVTAEMSASFERGCRLGFVPACRNVARMASGGDALESAPPTLDDYPIVLRGTKAAITDRTPSALYARACLQGWPETCGRGGDATGR